MATLTYWGMTEGPLEVDLVPRYASHPSILCNPGVEHEHTGLIQVGPAGGEFIVEHEPHLVVVWAVLGEGGGTPDASGCLHEEVLDY